MRLRYRDSSSMADHLNAFQGHINQTISTEVPLVDEMLALLLLGSLPDSGETLAVNLDNSAPQGEQMTLDIV